MPDASVTELIYEKKNTKQPENVLKEKKIFQKLFFPTRKSNILSLFDSFSIFLFYVGVFSGFKEKKRKKNARENCIWKRFFFLLFLAEINIKFLKFSFFDLFIKCQVITRKRLWNDFENKLTSFSTSLLSVMN